MKLPITKTQLAAWTWLLDRGGVGYISASGNVVSSGSETAPFSGIIWRRLAEKHFVEIKPGSRGHRYIVAIKLDPPLNLSEADIEENVLAIQAIAEKHVTGRPT